MEGTIDTIDQAVKATTMKTGKFLTFSLEEEEYGIGIRKVKEIIGMMSITSVPQAPEFVKGVINLRGKVIPVIDLRAKFDMKSIPQNERTCIIVVEIDADDSFVSVGIVVDSVCEVLNISEKNVEAPPAFGNQLDTRYIFGMAKMGSGVKILLNIDRVLSTEEITAIERVS